jgi:hypothetical protein
MIQRVDPNPAGANNWQFTAGSEVGFGFRQLNPSVESEVMTVGAFVPTGIIRNNASLAAVELFVQTPS